jgi:hypothetical protein
VTYFQNFWVEMRENNQNWLMVQMSRWQFVNELQFTYDTLESEVDIEMELNLRDASGEALLT